MASQKPRQAPRRNRPPTRAQRRAAERAQARQQAAQPKRDRTGQIVGGVITALILAVVVIYALVRSNALGLTGHKTAGPALAVASDLHPVSSMLAVGQKAPNFTLKSVNGKSFTLAAQKGHPVVLEFFAVWCPHCQHEAPLIQKLTNQYTAKGVRVWAILANPYGPNYDNSYGLDTTPAKKADLAWFSRTFGEHVPQLIDPHFKVVNEYGVNGYPGIYVINAHGVIVHSSSGEQPYSTLANAVNKAMAA